MRKLILIALLASPLAHAEVIPPGASLMNQTFAVRQGARLLSSHTSAAACEAEAQRQTVNAVAARRKWEVKTGTAVLVSSHPRLAVCQSATIDRLNGDTVKVSGSNVNSCVETVSFSSAFQPPACVATYNYMARYRADTPPPTCGPTPAPIPQPCPIGADPTGFWQQRATMGPAPECAITWSSTPAANECQPVPPPTCTDPLPSSRLARCPAGTTGMYQQNPSRAPYPECVTWSTTPAAGECPPEPSGGGLPAPQGLSITMTSPTTIRIQWLEVAQSGAYQLETCRGANCTNFAPVSPCTLSFRMNQTLPVNATIRARVRTSRNTSCSTATGNLSPWSGIVSGGTVPDAPVVGSAVLNWTRPTLNDNGTVLTDLAGYRIVYGQNPAALTSTIQINNTALTTYTVQGLTNGTWHFAMKAFKAGNVESAQSNISAKTVR